MVATHRLPVGGLESVAPAFSAAAASEKPDKRWRSLFHRQLACDGDGAEA